MKEDATTVQSHIGDEMSSAARKIVGRTVNLTVYLMLVDQLQLVLLELIMCFGFLNEYLHLPQSLQVHQSHHVASIVSIAMLHK
jgi:hypothetical protein